MCSYIWNNERLELIGWQLPSGVEFTCSPGASVGFLWVVSFLPPPRNMHFGLICGWDCPQLVEWTWFMSRNNLETVFPWVCRVWHTLHVCGCVSNDLWYQCFMCLCVTSVSSCGLSCQWVGCWKKSVLSFVAVPSDLQLWCVFSLSSHLLLKNSELPDPFAGVKCGGMWASFID